MKINHLFSFRDTSSYHLCSGNFKLAVLNICETMLSLKAPMKIPDKLFSLLMSSRINLILKAPSCRSSLGIRYNFHWLIITRISSIVNFWQQYSKTYRSGNIYLNDLHFSSILYFSVGTQIDADRVVSRLRIQGATSGDTGNYTCRIGENLSDYPRGRVKVHVVDGNYHYYRLAEKSSVIIVFLTLSTFMFILIWFHF